MPVWLENAYSRPKNWGFGGISTRKWEAISTKTPKGTSSGRSGSSGVLSRLMSVSAVVPEKSPGNKKCDEEEEEEEEEEERHIFGLCIAVKWPRHGCMQLFYDIYMFTLSRTARWCQYFINSAFLSFFSGCQKSALIAILKTPSGSISFDSWLRCYRIV